MRATEFIVEGLSEGSLNEYRDQLWTWVQSKFPRTQWPEYVQRDFLYAKAKGNKNQKDLEDFLDEIQRDFGHCKWTLTKIPITLDIFTPKTQRMIQSREGGSSNPFQVPKDAERHAQQSQMIQQKGVSAEPIIVAKLSNGYDLIEGWHRTIQHLKAFPQGYTGPAWVCTGATYKSESVEQGVTAGLDEAVGDNYLYHATMPAGIMRILRTGIIKATDRPQSSTKSKTQYPTISTTRSKQYAESNDFVDFLNLTKDGNSVILVFDRTAVANHYKMFSTSQGTQTVGDEYEEVIVAPKGSMPIKGTLKGFYFNPKRTGEIQEYQDVPWFNELLNSPYYMGQKQGVAEGLNESLSSLVAQDQSERNEYKNFVKSQAGGDWSKGAKMYAQLKKRPSNDIFGDAARLNQFMKMKFDFDKFTDEDWDNYWLLAQHCDDNRDFQKNALSIIKKYQGTDHSHYKYLYDRISMGLIGKQKYGTQNTKKQGVDEGFSNDMSTEDMIAYLRQHHDTNLHQDYLNHLNTFSKFVLKDIPTNTLKTDLPGLDREKVERYKKMDHSKAPPIVLGGKYILDGYHRANAVKELGIPTIKAYVGITTK